MESIRFTFIQPCPELSRDIECIRIATQTASHAAEVKTCPSGYPGIVFHLAEDGLGAIESISTRASRTTALPALFLHGQDAEPSVMRFRAIPYTTIQVVFKSHALYSLFGWDAARLRGRWLPAVRFGASELERSLLSTSADAERVRSIERFLTERLALANRRDELVERMVEFMRERIAELSVSRAVAAFPISERQFQKRFARVVGLPPQLFVRLLRANEAIRLMESGRFERLSDVAHEMNYYDQSHFIREIRTFSWVNPKQLYGKEEELHVDETGASYT
ncbi:MAG TPA: AraC family transcriptional regulator [Paenibacillus sp.]|nr:AraC family transcriptional regulator [Paenibacillus sp.]